MCGRVGGRTAKGEEELVDKESSHESLIQQAVLSLLIFLLLLAPRFAFSL